MSSIPINQKKTAPGCTKQHGHRCPTPLAAKKTTLGDLSIHLQIAAVDDLRPK
jgi:hypothetical protein